MAAVYGVTQSQTRLEQLSSSSSSSSDYHTEAPRTRLSSQKILLTSADINCSEHYIYFCNSKKANETKSIKGGRRGQEKKRQKQNLKDIPHNYEVWNLFISNSKEL